MNSFSSGMWRVQGYPNFGRKAAPTKYENGKQPSDFSEFLEPVREWNPQDAFGPQLICAMVRTCHVVGHAHRCHKQGNLIMVMVV